MSIFYTNDHKIQSKYLQKWQNRHIVLDSHEKKMFIRDNDGKKIKSFSLDQVKTSTCDKGYVYVHVDKDRRKYKIDVETSKGLLGALDQYNLNSQIGGSVSENPIMLPKSINYLGMMPSVLFQSKPQSESDYPRQKSYLLEHDWAINNQNGGLILISEEKKSNQTKILKFALKKFIQTHSFMGISFPVFAMKPQSILETYAKSISAAPLFFEKSTDDPAERMKQFVAFITTFSRLFTDMDKPFNPVIGETYQTDIAGGRYTAEQTSHHPPQSSFFFQGKGYKIYATIQLVAEISINSAEGLFVGDIHVQFDDGGHIFGRGLAGQMKGFVVGENKFRPHGAAYAYDAKNNIVCTYKREHKDHFVGHIGTLKPQYHKKFQKNLQSAERFKKFTAFNEKDYELILSNVEIYWSKYVSFNKKVMVDFRDAHMLPFMPTQNGINLLKSDSSFRKDIQLRKLKMMDESQQQKERIQQLQRDFRKLRQNMYEKKK